MFDYGFSYANSGESCFLDNRKKQIILDIIESYLFVEDEEDESTIARDLKNIQIAEQELLNGKASQRQRRT